MIYIIETQLNEPKAVVNWILLTWDRFSLKGYSQGIRCVSLIGNPVKVGSGPAAVTLLFLLFVVYKERTLLAANATVSTNRDGKVAKRAGEPEDLPCQFAIVLRPLKNAHFCPRWNGAKRVFGNGFTLRKTENGQYIKKGQANWVQPFRQLEAWRVFLFYTSVWCFVFGV